MNRVILHLMLFVLVASLADATLYRTEDILISMDPESDIDSFESDINEIDSSRKRSDSKPNDYAKCFPHPCKYPHSIPKSLKGKTCKNLIYNAWKYAKTKITCANDKPGNAGLPKLSKILKKCITETTGCFETISNTNCPATEKYRRPDGTCNNVKQRLYGAAGTIQDRLFPSFYENKINSPRTSHLPNPRDVSRALVLGRQEPNPSITDMVKTFGQFVDHDITETPMADFSQCATCTRKNECFPIPGTIHDSRISEKKCLRFGRSLPACGTGISSIIGKHWIARQQVNKITSFLDGSNIYGSSEELLKRLRDENKGSLKVDGNNNLPQNTEKCSDISCPNFFLAGDDRANENLQLIAMHTVWVRFHNYVVGSGTGNPDKDFNVARKIVGAILQKIVFEDYLPLIIGEELPEYQGYKHDVNPSIFNSFAAAAFRFGHTQIKDVIRRLKENLEPIDHDDIPLSDAFFNPKAFVEGEGVDPLMRGLFAEPGRRIHPGLFQTVALTIRDLLFPKDMDPAGDLPAFNIQRGRDHAIPGYTFVHKECGLGDIKSFAHLKKRMSSLAARRLAKIYRHGGPCSIDLWVGGVLEKPVCGGQVGETFKCLLRKQFLRLRDGDRFYFDQDTEFDKDQRAIIRKITLAHVICATTDIERIPENVFKTPLEDVDYCKNLKAKLGTHIKKMVSSLNA